MMVKSDKSASVERIVWQLDGKTKLLELKKYEFDSFGMPRLKLLLEILVH